MTETELKSMTDAEVLAWAQTANDDCLEAANTRRESEWHVACFAACFVLSQEMTKRGIRLKPLQQCSIASFSVAPNAVCDKWRSAKGETLE